METRPDARRIELTAREFLSAYLPYTHGHAGLLTKLRGGSVADPQLVTGLLQGRPHNIPSVAGVDTVTGVEVERVTSRRAVAVSQVRGRASRYSVALTLTRNAEGWIVTDTRPAG